MNPKRAQSRQQAAELASKKRKQTFSLWIEESREFAPGFFKILKSKHPLRLFMFCALSLAPAKGHAQLAVVDSAAIAQAIQQVEEMKQQYDMLKQQYNELVSVKENLSGSYGMGSLLNDLEAQELRRPLPKTWQEVVAGQADGFYGNRLDHYSKLFPQIEYGLIASNTQDRDVRGYQLAKSNTQSAFAAAEAVYNQIEKRIQTIEELVLKIDQTPNVKAAMDLNSRIVAETGFISLDLARLNTMHLSLQAVVQNESNRSLENHSEFFSIKN